MSIKGLKCIWGRLSVRWWVSLDGLVASLVVYSCPGIWQFVEPFHKSTLCMCVG